MAQLGNDSVMVSDKISIEDVKEDPKEGTGSTKVKTKKENLKVAKVNHPVSKCKFCDAKFYLNCQLETHVVDVCNSDLCY